MWLWCSDLPGKCVAGHVHSSLFLHRLPSALGKSVTHWQHAVSFLHSQVTVLQMGHRGLFPHVPQMLCCFPFLPLLGVWERWPGSPFRLCTNHGGAPSTSTLLQRALLWFWPKASASRSSVVVAEWERILSPAMQDPSFNLTLWQSQDYLLQDRRRAIGPSTSQEDLPGHFQTTLPITPQIMVSNFSKVFLITVIS